jgi:hypothetical protein
MEDLLKKKIYVFAKLSKKVLNGKNKTLEIKIDSILFNLGSEEYKNIHIPEDIICNFRNNIHLETDIKNGLKKLSESLENSTLKNILNESNNSLIKKKRQEVLIMGGFIGSNSTKNVFKVIIEKNGEIKFENSIPMCKDRFNQSAVYWNKKVYSIGGDIASNIEYLDISKQKAVLLEGSLPGNLMTTDAVIFKEKLLIMGGQNHSNIVWELDLANSESTWTRNSYLNIGRNSSSSAVLDGKIFLCGGYMRGADKIREVEVFDGKKWIKESKEMEKDQVIYSLFVYDAGQGQELYAVGGCSNLGNKYITIQKRDKDTKEWTIITKLTGSRDSCASCLVDSKIFLFGGISNPGTFNYFDLIHMKWASEDEDCRYYDREMRKLPRSVISSKAVLITPSEA